MMERLRVSIEQALREAERHNQPPIAALRPPARWQAPPIDREGQDAEPWVGVAAELPPPPPPMSPALPLDLRATFNSRAALRQAFFLREILGPPRALQGPHEDGR